MTRIPMISADEYDALTKRGRNTHKFRAGERAKVKRAYRRRARSKKAFDQIAEGLTEALSVARGKTTPAKWHAPADSDADKVVTKTRDKPAK